VHLLIVALFVLLLACGFYLLLLHRKYGSSMSRTHPKYRHNQVLIGLIATLVILLPLLIVFSSDPGTPDDYLWLP
jgi:hypothetical protein